MYLKHSSCDHNQDNMYLALGYSKQQEIRIRERIIFHKFNRVINLYETYGEDMDEAPAEERTTSATLHEILQTIDNAAEYEGTLLMFNKVDDVCRSIMQAYLMLQRDEVPDLAKRMMRHKLEEASLEMEKENENNPAATATTAVKMLERVDMVKECNGSFEMYMKMYAEKNYEPVHTDVDAMLDGLFDFE